MKDPQDDADLIDWLASVADWDAEKGGPDIAQRLTYGPDPSHTVDIWRPAPGVVPRGAIVAIHGGYFMQEFAADLQNPMVRDWARKGFTVFNIEYRRHGCGGGFYETTADVWLAVDTIAKEFALSGLSVVGHSAGGYLAQWVAPHPAVSLVIPMASVSDLAAGLRSGLDEGAIARWMGATPDQDDALYAASDLTARLPARAQQWLVHGTADTVVDVGQSRAFHAVACAAGEDCHLVELPDEGHFGFLDPRETAYARVAKVLLDAV